MSKPTVAFICVHNSCRSQMAEALGHLLAADAFNSVSAGTEVVPRINQDAVRLMKDRYQVDMEKTQYSKLVRDIGDVDIVVTMGCNVACRRYRQSIVRTGASMIRQVKVTRFSWPRWIRLRKKCVTCASGFWTARCKLGGAVWPLTCRIGGADSAS